MHICVTQEGRTALMEAACRGHMEVVRVLLAAGADINRQDKVSANPDEINEIKKNSLLFSNLEISELPIELLSERLALSFSGYDLPSNFNLK